MWGKKSDVKTCPLLNKPCVGSECMWATKMRGFDPQTNAEIDEEGCAIVWLPTLLTQNIQANHQTGAAVESFRNETMKAHSDLASVQVSTVLNQISAVRSKIEG